MTRIIIDANHAVFGRLCSFAAKNALGGNEVIVLNCNKALITGNKEDIIQKYTEMKKRGGNALKGPNYSRVPFMMLKRGIRGMLPNYREGIGKQAFARIKCYNDLPKEFEKEKMIKSGKTKSDKFIELKELSERI